MAETFTLTFGDQAENHVRMQKIGQLAQSGFTLEDLQHAQTRFEAQGAHCELLHLNKQLPNRLKADDAFILVIRGGVDAILQEQSTANDMLQAQQSVGRICWRTLH